MRLPTLLQDFSDPETLTMVDGTLTNEHTRTGTLSARLLAGLSPATVDFALPELAPDGLTQFYVRFYNDVTGAASPGAFTLYVGTDPAFGAGTWTSAALSQYEGVRDQPTYKSGWNTAIAGRADFTLGTPAILDNPATRLTVMRVRIEAGKGPLHLDSVYARARDLATILLMFDDGHESIFATDVAYGGVSAFAYMRDNGLRATLYVTGGVVDTPSWLTSAQIDEMYAAGWDVCNHTFTHPSVEGLSDPQLATELSESDAVLVSNGWLRGRRHFAYPTGAFTLDTDPARLLAAGFITARSIQSTVANNPFDPDNIRHLWAKGINTGSTILAASVMTAAVDAAISAGRAAGVYLHALGADSGNGYTWPHASMRTLLDHVIRSRDSRLCDVRTITEWYEEIRLLGNRLGVNRLPR